MRSCLSPQVVFGGDWDSEYMGSWYHQWDVLIMSIADMTYG